MRHHEIKEFTRGNAKHALVGIKLHLKASQHDKCLLKVGDMVLDSSAFDKHVIHVIHLHVLADLLFEDFVDELLVGRTHILQAEGYNLVVKKTLVSDK